VYYTGETLLTGGTGLGEQTFTPHVVDIGVILDVTPQIAADGSIIMNIHPSFSEKIEDVPSPDGITTFPLLSVRETDTVVRVQDGQTIIIAGLLTERTDEEQVGLPCLMSIPGVGQAFRHTDRKFRKAELVILLTPTVLVGRRVNEMGSEERRRLDEVRMQSPLR
jgi:general secretion pathway protein D